MRLARLVGVDRKARVTQITTLYKCGRQQSILDMSKPELQKLETTSGSTPVSLEHKSEAAMGTASLKLDN